MSDDADAPLTRVEEFSLHSGLREMARDDLGNLRAVSLGVLARGLNEETGELEQLLGRLVDRLEYSCFPS